MAKVFHVSRLNPKSPMHLWTDLKLHSKEHYDTNMLENHEVIDEENRFALKQFPHGLQSLASVLSQHCSTIAASGVRQQVHPVNILQPQQTYHFFEINQSNY